jgi:hypothetical protein
MKSDIATVEKIRMLKSGKNIGHIALRPKCVSLLPAKLNPIKGAVVD